VYCFFGIQLATQNYINPAIDIIKKKGLLGAELMNVSLLAMSNSLAESFIIVNSIFFGVSDIGISTVVQQAAFYGLINQGMFYLIVQEGTLIDWWIVSRETAFFLLYLAVMSVLLYGNQVELIGAVILLLLYVVHIFLMKYSSKYEVVIKKLLAQKLEINELNRMANN
jgi:Ca2+/Na+ antiporter